MTDAKNIARFQNALPFMITLLLVPLIICAALWGGWWLVLPPMFAWHTYTIVDMLTGLNTDNADPMTADSELFWYRALTGLWAPIEFIMLFGVLAYVTQSGHLAGWEQIVLFFDVGIMTGTIGIVYAHELMHQKPKWERWLGDVLLSMVLYAHYRSEHLLVHHRYVGTPRDAVTARYNEGFHRFFARVLPASLVSSFRAEQAMLARRKLPWWHRTNPFWRYWVLQAAMLALALWVGGWAGLGLFLWQALVAVWQLELTNYVEHYGLTREYLGDGKFEHVKPRHSWNAAHRATNWLLINLQRHSDHHYKPDRRFPLLQTYDTDDAPQLPYGYPLMTAAAMVPPLWRRVMNPRVRAWRKQHYPHITDWMPYKTGRHPAG